MNWADTVVLLVVVVSTIVAFARGFIAEALGIAAWVGAYFVATLGAPLLSPMMRDWIGNREFADPAAYAIVFFAALVALSLVTGAIGGAVRASILGGLDRTLGLLFGAVRGVVILAATYVALVNMLPSERWPAAVAQARSLPYIYQSAQSLLQLVPPQYRPRLPPPPSGRETTATDLLQVTPLGKAIAKP